jgi:hypothetical protein
VGGKRRNRRGQRNKWKRKKVEGEKDEETELRVLKNGYLKRTQSPYTCHSEIAIVTLKYIVPKSKNSRKSILHFYHSNARMMSNVPKSEGGTSQSYVTAEHFLADVRDRRREMRDKRC